MMSVVNNFANTGVMSSKLPRDAISGETPGKAGSRLTQSLALFMWLVGGLGQLWVGLYSQAADASKPNAEHATAGQARLLAYSVMLQVRPYVCAGCHPGPEISCNILAGPCVDGVC